MNRRGRAMVAPLALLLLLALLAADGDASNPARTSQRGSKRSHSTSGRRTTTSNKRRASEAPSQPAGGGGAEASGSKPKRRSTTAPTRPVRRATTDEDSEKVTVYVYPLDSGGSHKKELECRVRHRDGRIVRFADLLAFCADQLGLAGVKPEAWQFVHVEAKTIANQWYELTDKVAGPVFDGVAPNGKSPVQIWQWKDVDVLVEYERLEADHTIGDERYTATVRSPVSVLWLWRLKFAGSSVDPAVDLDASARKRGESRGRAGAAVAAASDGRPLFLLGVARIVGEPLTLLLREKRQVCPVSGKPMSVDRDVTAKWSCGHRALAWTLLDGPKPSCPSCKAAWTCDRCGKALGKDERPGTYPCGHVFHAGCTDRQGCSACSAVVVKVELPDGSVHQYLFPNRHSKREHAVTPAVLARLYSGEWEPRFNAQLIVGGQPKPAEMSVDLFAQVVPHLPQAVVLRFTAAAKT